MKNFYKEFLKREGGKRNLNSADASQSMRIVAEMLCDPHTDLHIREFEKYLQATMSRMVRKHNGKHYKATCLIGFRLAPRLKAGK